MTQQKLSKAEMRAFIGLAQQRQELQEAFAEIVEAERQQIEFLRQKYELPEALYEVRQTADGVMMCAVEEEGDDE